MFHPPLTEEASLKPLTCCWSLLLLAACGPETPDVRFPGRPGPVVEVPGARIEVPPPPFTQGAFPCSECHEQGLPVNKNRRELKMAHQEIVLHHDEEHRWCLDCHSAENRDKLHLANGQLIDFTESYRLCGQCHGDKYRDWRLGIHGRRIGEWNGQKSYLLCVHCHSSHAPHFAPLQPKPIPVRPADLARGASR